jgi:hypothetical protein
MATLEERLDYGIFRVEKREDGTLWVLGRGAMGVTYRAVNTALDVPVALKVIDLESGVRPEDEKRFVCEARAMAGLRHKHIASVYHLAREGGQFFYAMELINGDTAQEFVERCGPMPVEAVLRVGSQVCLALAASARQRLVHRDVKPANIMILADVDEDEWPFVKLIDFGLVRSLSANREASYATLPGFVGTAQFASPEQIREDPVDARADIYSLGCTLWYLLTGGPPFEGSLAQVFSQHLHAEPPWEKLRAFPKPVVRLLRGALQKDPQRRPDAIRFRREIASGLASLSRQVPVPVRSRFIRGENAWPVRLAVALVCLVVLVLLALAPGSPQKRPATEAAALAAARENTPKPAPPRWEYAAATFPASDFLGSSRPMRLERPPIPSLGPPGGGGWLGGEPAFGDLWVGPWDWNDPVLLARLHDLEPEAAQSAPRKAAVRPTAARREEGFNPRREIDRARRTVEKTLRRLF